MIKGPNLVLYLLFSNASPADFTQIQKQNILFYQGWNFPIAKSQQCPATILQCISCTMICGQVQNAFLSWSNNFKRILKPELAWMLYNDTQDLGLLPRFSLFGFLASLVMPGNLLNMVLGSVTSWMWHWDQWYLSAQSFLEYDFFKLKTFF